MGPTKRWGWVYFMVGVGLSVAWTRVGGVSIDLTRDSGLWFSTIVFLLLAAFVLEPWYSGAGTTITNSLLVIVGVLTAGFEEYAAWWVVLLSVSVLVFAAMAISSLLEVTLGNRLVDPLRRLARTLGSWRVLPLGLVILTALTFSEPMSVEWHICMGVVVYTFGTSHFRIERLVRFGKRVAASDTCSAIVVPPDEIILMDDISEYGYTVGDTVNVETRHGNVTAIVVAPTVAGSVASWSLFSHRVRDLLPRHSQHIVSSTTQARVTMGDETQSEILASYLTQLSTSNSEILGASVEGSEIDEIVIDLRSGISMEVGDMCVTYRNRRPVHWQVTGANVNRVSWPGDTQKHVHVSAIQLGEWDVSRQRFVGSVVSPPAVELALTPALVHEPESASPESRDNVRIGVVQGSEFPVNISPALMGRHHTAVLGVTGTGKTHLVFSLVDSLVTCGTRVLCADLTGQYAERYSDAPTVSYSDLEGFLDDLSEHPVGICDFTISSSNPISQALALAKSVFEHVKTEGRLNPAKPARFVLVLEEAHNFVPENFMINDWDLKAEAQATSKILMEARKFGLGFIVVTQRTATITKSALSQCGSLFVFRTVDKTGQDYLEGMCGRALLNSLPLLRDRTALVMGRALASESPLLMRVDDVENPID